MSEGFHEAKLGEVPLARLGLRIAGTPLQAVLAAFDNELRAAGIDRVRPRYYLSTEWGVPFETIALAIPFYLASPALAELHAERTGMIEGHDREEILRYLRHEMGHVVNYAYRLYDDGAWVETDVYTEKDLFMSRLEEDLKVAAGKALANDDKGPLLFLKGDKGTDWGKVKTILLAALTIAFLLACATLLPYSIYAVMQAKAADAASTAQPITVTVLVALLVCLIPTTIGGLLSAIRIAGMDRLVQANVIATSGRAVEAAGDVDVLLLDKTGTITFGNRMASAFCPVDGVKPEELADAAQLSSLADETPEGRSSVVLAKQKYNIRERDMHVLGFDGKPATFVPFTANTRMSGVDLPVSTQFPQGRQIPIISSLRMESSVRSWRSLRAGRPGTPNSMC